MVGIVGFEPTTPCSQSRCANQAALHPVTMGIIAYIMKNTKKKLREILRFHTALFYVLFFLVVRILIVIVLIFRAAFCLLLLFIFFLLHL